MHIEFAPEEAEVLREILEHGLNEVDMEVVRTDTRDFRTMLKHRREVLEHILAKLSVAPVAGWHIPTVQPRYREVVALRGL